MSTHAAHFHPRNVAANMPRFKQRPGGKNSQPVFSLVPPAADGVSALNMAKLRAYQSNTLFDFVGLLPEEISADKAYQLILEVIGVLFEVTQGAVLELTPSGMHMEKVGVLGPLEIKNNKLWHHSLILNELKKGRPQFIDHSSELKSMGLPESVETAWVFPIFRRNRLAWLIEIYNTPLDNESIQILQSFCRNLSLPLENILLRAQLNDQNRRLAAVANFSAEINSHLELNSLYHAILKNSAAMVGAGRGSLLLVEPEREVLTIRAAMGEDAKALEQASLPMHAGIVGMVFESGKPLLVKNIKADHRFQEHCERKYQSGSFLSVPILIQNRKIGVLNLTDKTDSNPFNEADLQLLESVATHAALALERSHYFAKNETLKRISETDSLTELYNRRYFQDRLAEELQRAERYNHPLSIIMLDMDNFKRINDSFGHSAGDEALKVVAHDLRQSVRNIDTVARFGGEEFAIILPMADTAVAKHVAERIRRRVAQQRTPTTETVKGWNLSVSLGISSFPNHATSASDLIEAADKGLYAAKNAGKNRVAVSVPAGHKALFLDSVLTAAV